MKKKLLIGLPILASLLVGIYVYTYNSVPKCSDEAVIDLIEKKFLGKPDKDSIKATRDGFREVLKNYKGALDKESIVTIDKNSETGTYTCQASVKLNFSGPNIPFTYLVGLTDNGEEFYVKLVR